MTTEQQQVYRNARRDGYSASMALFYAKGSMGLNTVNQRLIAGYPHSRNALDDRCKSFRCINPTRANFPKTSKREWRKLIRSGAVATLVS